MEHVLEVARDRWRRLRAGPDAVIWGVTGCPIPVTEPPRPIYFNGDGRGISCEAIMHAVAERGLSRLLVEGGAHTVSWFLKEGQLDRLHILLAPVLLGDGRACLQTQAAAGTLAARRVDSLSALLEQPASTWTRISCSSTARGKFATQ